MLADAIQFFTTLTTAQILAYFWPFFFLDMLRYVIIEGIVLLKLGVQRSGYAVRMKLARRQAFKEKPLVSIIVPGKNEGKHIPRLVDSLKQQTYSNYELIIVDDGSDDDTEVLCRSLLQQNKIDQFIRNEQRGGKASAANIALQYCNGQYVLHLDADSHLVPQSIEFLVSYFYLYPKAGVVGGDVRVFNVSDSISTQLQNIEYSKSLMLGRTVASELAILRIVSGACGMFRLDLLQKIHGWDVGPGLDGDITLKIRKLNYEVIHCAEAECYTHVPNKFRKLSKQRYRWDKSMIRFRLRKHRDMLLPSAEFKFSNFYSVFENLFFNLFLDLKWFIYLIQVTTTFSGEKIVLIFIINYFLYFLSNVVQYFFIVYFKKLNNQDHDHHIALFLPLMPMYTGLYLRGVRTFSYLMEFFYKSSYNDPWNPWKVSKIALKNHL